MLDAIEETLSASVSRWLADFEAAVQGGDPAALEPLFLSDSHWRDLLAFTWHLTTTSGAQAIAGELSRRAATVGARDFKIDPERTPPRMVTRAGTEAVEAIFGFETELGRGSGVLRLIRDGEDTPKAWTLMTELEEIAGHGERIGTARPTGEAYSRDFSGPNWLDGRKTAAAYADRDPAVLVVGGGQAGLSIGARLTQLGVDTLIVDREEHIGDNWRKRYHALALHNQVHVNHLPYMPFPPNFPTYIPKDKLASWFEAYAEAMELNFWTSSEFAGGRFDEDAGRWSVTLRHRDGSSREMHPRHIVMATGVSGIPNLPDIPSLGNFAGEVIHSSQYDVAETYKDRTVLIVGTGNSGHDIAQDLHSHGANVTMIQRSPTLIIDVEPSAQIAYALYDEGPALDDCDLITTSVPFALLKKAHQAMTAQAREIDKELLDGLASVGFKMDFGEDDTGWQFKYLTRGGGYYFNVGCSDLLIERKIGLIQYHDIDAFVADGARMKSGETVPADLIVLATGFKGQDALVSKLFGDDVARRVGPVWGFDPETQELRNMWMRTGQPGLWFMAGSFAQCRIYSKHLGLQIKACEEGLIPLVREQA